jgi:hypothetical protein
MVMLMHTLQLGTTEPTYCPFALAPLVITQKFSVSMLPKVESSF